MMILCHLVSICALQAEAQAALHEMESEVVRLRGAVEDARRGGDTMTLTAELAALNNQKVQIQREFEAFKEMATAAARNNREEVAKLLEQNAALHARLAAKAAETVAGACECVGHIAEISYSCSMIRVLSLHALRCCVCKAYLWCCPARVCCTFCLPRIDMGWRVLGAACSVWRHQPHVQGLFRPDTSR